MWGSSVDGRITTALGAISTTGRRSTTRPCKLSRSRPSPSWLRCALPRQGRATSRMIPWLQPIKTAVAGY